MNNTSYIKVLFFGFILTFGIVSLSYSATKKTSKLPNSKNSIKTKRSTVKKTSNKNKKNNDLVENTLDKKEKIEFTDPEKTILVNRSKPYFSIIVKSNPTTGFSWVLKNYDSELITPVRRRFYQYDKKSLMVGASGYEKWVFRVKPAAFLVPQITSINLMYMRPWDEQGAQVLNFKLVTNNVDKTT